MATRWDGRGDGRAVSSGGEAEDGPARRSWVIKPLNLRPRELEINLTSGEIPFLIEWHISHQERDSPCVCSWPCGAWRQVETRADGHQAHICTLDFLPNSRTGDLPFGATSSLAGLNSQRS